MQTITDFCTLVHLKGLSSVHIILLITDDDLCNHISSYYHTISLSYFGRECIDERCAIKMCYNWPLFISHLGTSSLIDLSMNYICIYSFGRHLLTKVRQNPIQAQRSPGYLTSF